MEEEQSSDGVRAQSELRSGQHESKEEVERASNAGKIGRAEESRGAGEGGGGVREWWRVGVVARGSGSGGGVRDWREQGVVVVVAACEGGEGGGVC